MRSLLLSGLVASMSAQASASECDSPAAEWLFCEDIEGGGAGWGTWFAQSPFVECLGCSSPTANNPARIRLVNDPAQAHDGDWSLSMPAEAAASYQGASLTYRSCSGAKQQNCALTNYAELYYRAWVRLAPDHQYVHHFMSIGGTRPDGYWDGDGGAGCRPNGYAAAGTTLDFNANRELFFYTYFPEMGCDDIYVGSGYCGAMQPTLCDDCAAREMPCLGEPECCWGNLYSATPRPVLPRGEWVCLEMMMRLNSVNPVAADGEMAFWVNGVLGHRQTGMHWRDVPELGLNKIWVQHYIATGDATQSNQIQWDDIIGSTARIGCGASPTPDGGPFADGAPSGDGPALSDPSAGDGATDDGPDADRTARLLPAVEGGCACGAAATPLGLAGLLALRRRRR